MNDQTQEEFKNAIIEKNEVFEKDLALDKFFQKLTSYRYGFKDGKKLTEIDYTKMTRPYLLGYCDGLKVIQKKYSRLLFIIERTKTEAIYHT